MKLMKAFIMGSLLSIVSSGAGATLIRLHTSNGGTTQPGETFTVDVVLENAFSGIFAGDELLAFGFNLSYDNTVIQLTSASVGAGWDDDSIFFDDIDVAGSTFPGIADDGLATPIVLAQLTFTAFAAGFTDLIISGNSLDNIDLGLIYLSGEAAISAQTRITAVPEPAAWLLLASGLGALGSRRRRH